MKRRTIVGNSVRRRCYICGQIEGDLGQDLIAAMLPAEPYRRRVIMENDWFAVIPSLGALTPGHVLLCPRSHARCFAEIAWDEAKVRMYRAIRTKLIEQLELCYGGAVHVFEHGMATNSEHVPCTVDHAHLHFLPVQRGEHTFDSEAWEATDPAIETLGNHTRGLEYLFHEDPSGVARLRTGPPGSFGSQLLRRQFASILDCGERWNWRDNPNAVLADEIFERLHSSSIAWRDP